MGAMAALLNIFGVVLLAHAYVHPSTNPAPVNTKLTLVPENSVYSAYEHSLLPTSSLPTKPSAILPQSLDPKVNLPTDVTLETLLSAFLLCIGTVLSSPGLKPIQWNVWAGKVERSTEARQMKQVGVGGGNPYAGLEDRPGFVDIRAARKEFGEWVKEGVRP